MSQIAKSFFEQSPVMVGPLIAMVIFMAVFAAVIVRVLRANNDHVDRSARLALDDVGEGLKGDGGEDV